MDSQIKLLYIDLFCGAGGTSTGVERAKVNNQPVNAAVQMVLTLLLEWKIELNQDVKFHYSEQ